MSKHSSRFDLCRSSADLICRDTRDSVPLETLALLRRRLARFRDAITDEQCTAGILAEATVQLQDQLGIAVAQFSQPRTTSPVELAHVLDSYLRSNEEQRHRFESVCTQYEEVRVIFTAAVRQILESDTLAKLQLHDNRSRLVKMIHVGMAGTAAMMLGIPHHIVLATALVHPKVTAIFSRHQSPGQAAVLLLFQDLVDLEETACLLSRRTEEVSKVGLRIIDDLRRLVSGAENGNGGRSPGERHIAVPRLGTAPAEKRETPTKPPGKARGVTDQVSTAEQVQASANTTDLAKPQNGDTQTGSAAPPQSLTASTTPPNPKPAEKSATSDSYADSGSPDVIHGPFELEIDKKQGKLSRKGNSQVIDLSGQQVRIMKAFFKEGWTKPLGRERLVELAWDVKVKNKDRFGPADGTIDAAISKLSGKSGIIRKLGVQIRLVKREFGWQLEEIPALSQSQASEDESPAT